MRLFFFDILDKMKSNMVDVLLISTIMIVILILIVKFHINNNKEGLSLRDAEKHVTLLNNSSIEQHEISKEYDGMSEFCKTHIGKSDVLEEKCKSLHNDTCKNTSCCVLSQYKDGSSQCVAGSRTGPTFLSDEKQNMIEIDNYYYMNKCYGNNCE